jgi:hypothetical protein
MSSLSAKIVATPELFKGLEKHYAGLRYDIDMFKPFFATDKKLFFDCRNAEDKNICLARVLARQDFEDFSVLFVAKEEDKSTGRLVHTVNESKFARMGQEKPEDFINRYNKNLKEPLALSMQLFGVQPVELIGFSYTSPEERAELMKQ